MATTQPITYVRIAEVLTDLGMITEEKARAVLAETATFAAEPIEDTYEIASALESFAVAVSIHTEDVDFADEHYEWLLNEAASVTGGTVTIANYRFEKAEPEEEDCGRGTMHFERNGEPFSIGVDQDSNDYLDMGAAQDAILALNTPDDPREFRLVKQEGPDLDDDIMVLATAEQRESLHQHLGITFEHPS